MPDDNITKENKLILETYIELIKSYNQRFNLISSGDLSIIWQRHILDSLQLRTYLLQNSMTETELSPSLQKASSRHNGQDSEKSKQSGKLEAKNLRIKNSINILDIGSGAGFPAIPLAITNPSHNFYLIESSIKKANFLKDVSRVTKLNNCITINQRLEHFVDSYKVYSKKQATQTKDLFKQPVTQELSTKAASNSPNLPQQELYEQVFPPSFDIIMARAFGSLREIVRQTYPLIGQKTRYILPKGQNYQKELDKLKQHLASLNRKAIKFKLRLVDSLTQDSSKIIIIDFITK